MFRSLHILLISCLFALAGCLSGDVTSDGSTTVSCYDTPDGVICSEGPSDEEPAEGEEGEGEGEEGGDDLVCEDTGCVTECHETDYGHRCVTECEGGLRCVKECEGEGDDFCSELICECPHDGEEDPPAEEDPPVCESDLECYCAEHPDDPECAEPPPEEPPACESDLECWCAEHPDDPECAA